MTTNQSLPVALPPAITDTLKATLAANVAVGGLVVSLNIAATPVPSPSFGGEATLSMFMVAAANVQTDAKVSHINAYTSYTSSPSLSPRSTVTVGEAPTVAGPKLTDTAKL